MIDNEASNLQDLTPLSTMARFCKASSSLKESEEPLATTCDVDRLDLASHLSTLPKVLA
jgi:hypothetical protein